MFWAVLLARVVLGLPFVVFSLNFFFHFMANPPGPSPESPAAQFTGAMIASGYFNVVKVLELVGGLLVISGRLVPLGLTILTPIAVNILLYEVFLVGQAGPGVALVALCVR